MLNSVKSQLDEKDIIKYGLKALLFVVKDTNDKIPFDF